MTKSIPPPLLYKYLPDRDDFFEKPCVRFTPINELNDPFESQLCVSQASVQFGNTSIDYSGFMQNCLNKLINGLSNSGILSLTSNPADLLMWAHYTNNHKGFVLGLDSSNEFLEGIDKVNYSQNRVYVHEISESKALGASLLYRNLYHKSCHWGYEDEWRLHKPFVSSLPRVKSDVVGLVSCPISAIKCICLGLRVSRVVKDKAKEFCSLHPTVELLQATLAQSDYSLVFIKIDE